MPATGELNWERVDLFVDRQISPEKLHVWPFDPSYPVDVRCLVMDRRHNVPMHRPDHLEVVYFESGEMGYEVENDSYTLRKDDIIVVGDRIHHRCTPLGNSQPQARSVVLSFLPQLIHSGSSVGDEVQYLMPFTLLGSSLPNVIRAGTGPSREVCDLMHRIGTELPRASERSRLAVKTYLKMILLTLVNHYSELGEARETLGRHQSGLSRLRPVLEHLDQRYEEPIRVTDAARLCAMSACCFMHLFKEVTGQSFVAYLNHIRVSKAQNLLASTNKAISAISQETGFCNQSYFGVIFRRAVGMTPLAYRRAHWGLGG